jgi:hypothetical protein
VGGYDKIKFLMANSTEIFLLYLLVSSTNMSELKRIVKKLGQLDLNTFRHYSASNKEYSAAMFTGSFSAILIPSAMIVSNNMKAIN